MVMPTPIAMRTIMMTEAIKRVSRNSNMANEKEFEAVDRD